MEEPLGRCVRRPNDVGVRGPDFLLDHGEGDLLDVVTAVFEGVEYGGFVNVCNV